MFLCERLKSTPSENKNVHNRECNDQCCIIISLDNNNTVVDLFTFRHHNFLDYYYTYNNKILLLSRFDKSLDPDARIILLFIQKPVGRICLENLGSNSGSGQIIFFTISPSAFSCQRQKYCKPFEYEEYEQKTPSGDVSSLVSSRRRH